MKEASPIFSKKKYNHAALRTFTQILPSKTPSIKIVLFAKLTKSNDINKKMNFMSTSLKRRKRSYFTNFFNENLNNLVLKVLKI